MRDKRKWKGNTGGSYLGQKLILLFFKMFDVRIGYAVMALFVPFYMLFHNKACKSIYNYFRLSFGFGAWKSFVWTYKNHFVFGQVILDRFAVFSGHKDFFEVEIIGNEHFTRLINSEKGFIIASSHTGNFEIGGYLLHQKDKIINALVYHGETKTVQRNRSRILESNNIRLIPVVADMSHLFAVHSALRDGNIVSMPCDRNLGSTKSVSCKFLGRTAAFPLGAFALAATLDVEVISIFVIKQSYRKYNVYVKPIEIKRENGKTYTRQEKIENHVHSFVVEMENIVRQFPEQWFNYYEFWEEA